MAIIGLQFNKINLEKMGAVKGKIEIKNTIAIKDVSSTPFSLGNSKQEVAKFAFEFVTDFAPSVAKILLVGDLLYTDKPEQITSIVDGWKKSKKLPKEIMGPIINVILSRCNVESIILSKELNLPSPIPLPKVTVK